MNQDKNIKQIDKNAQLLDAEYSIVERMKLTKESVKRLSYASIVYIFILVHIFPPFLIMYIEEHHIYNYWLYTKI
jgi:hypothetical protein